MVHEKLKALVQQTKKEKSNEKMNDEHVSYEEISQAIENTLEELCLNQLLADSGKKRLGQTDENIRFKSFSVKNGQLTLIVDDSYRDITFSIYNGGIHNGKTLSPFDRYDTEKDRLIKFNFIGNFFNQLTKDKIALLAHVAEGKVNKQLKKERAEEPDIERKEVLEKLIYDFASKKFKVKFKNGTRTLNYMHLGALIILENGLYVIHHEYDGPEYEEPSSGFMLHDYSYSNKVFNPNGLPLRDKHTFQQVYFCCDSNEFEFDRAGLCRENAKHVIELIEALGMKPEDFLNDNKISSTFTVPQQLLDTDDLLVWKFLRKESPSTQAKDLDIQGNL